VDEVAEALSMDPADVAGLRDVSQPIQSLDSPVGDDGELSLGQLIPSMAVEVEEQVLQHETTRAVRDLIASTLSEREREVIELRFGIDCEPRTLDDVGQRFGLTRERIRQIQSKAQEKLARPLVEAGLVDVIRRPAEMTTEAEATPEDAEVGVVVLVLLDEEGS
jgi:RNA polymerase sigma factor (sigma-70 family)